MFDSKNELYYFVVVLFDGCVHGLNLEVVINCCFEYCFMH